MSMRGFSRRRSYQRTRENNEGLIAYYRERLKWAETLLEQVLNVAVMSVKIQSEQHAIRQIIFMIESYLKAHKKIYAEKKEVKESEKEGAQA